MQSSGLTINFSDGSKVSIDFDGNTSYTAPATESSSTGILLAYGGESTASSGVLVNTFRILNGWMKVDNPLALILSPGSLSEGMTPAQMLLEMQQIEAGKAQVERLHKLMNGDVEGWMYAKDKTDHLKGGKQSCNPSKKSD